MKEVYHCEIYRDASARNAKAIKTTFARQLKVTKRQWAEEEAAKAAAKAAKEAAAGVPPVPPLDLQKSQDYAARASVDGSYATPLPSAHRASIDGTPFSPIKTGNSAPTLTPQVTPQTPT